MKWSILVALLLGYVIYTIVSFMGASPDASAIIAAVACVVYCIADGRQRSERSK